jgi:uncharacterized protein YjiS (DUF1127 family)
MNANFQISQPATRTRSLTRSLARSLARRNRFVTWILRKRAAAHARRALAQVDARTLRDIGFTRRDIAVFTMACFDR